MEQYIIPNELLQLLFWFCGGLTRSILFCTCKRFRKLIGNNKKNKNKICELAAGYGFLNILKWARENGCYWNSSICYYAAENGHLEVLKWAKENGCTWDKDLYIKSAEKNKHVDIIEWIKNN